MAEGAGRQGDAYRVLRTAVEPADWLQLAGVREGGGAGKGIQGTGGWVGHTTKQMQTRGCGDGTIRHLSYRHCFSQLSAIEDHRFRVRRGDFGGSLHEESRV